MKTTFKGSNPLMAIKFVLMAIRFDGLELLLILSVTVRHFKHVSQSNVKVYIKIYKFYTVLVLFKLHPVTRVPYS